MEGDRVMVPPYQQYRLYGQPKEYNFYLCISPVYVSIIMVKFDLLNQWYFHAIHDATMPRCHCCFLRFVQNLEGLKPPHYHHTLPYRKNGVEVAAT